jgi:uridine kinase
MNARLVIGIAGGSGSGKSSLVEHLKHGTMGASIAIVPHDAYYLSAVDIPPALRAAGDWDHPDALDNELLAAHIELLTSGVPIDIPVYDFATSSRTSRTVRIEPRPVVIVEGILVAAVERIRSLCELVVFVDASPEERLARRILRDTVQRGRSVESVIQQFRATARPAHDSRIEPSRRHAHVVVPWEGENASSPAVAMLEGYIAHVSGR